MSDMKTKVSDADPQEFLASVAHPGRREDAQAVMQIMQRVTGQPPRMWGDSMIGFGRYTYRRADGSEHAFFRTGLSPRKANLSIYLMPGVAKYASLLAKLGKHKHSVSCLYIGRLSGVDTGVLEQLIAAAYADMAQIYPDGADGG